MEQIHRDALRTNRKALIQDLEASKVASNLFGAGILDEQDKDLVQSKVTSRERAETLIDMLPRKGPKAFNALCDALMDISPHLELLINPTSTQGIVSQCAKNASKLPELKKIYFKSPVSLLFLYQNVWQTCKNLCIQPIKL
jgi:hypothetical protein